MGKLSFWGKKIDFSTKNRGKVENFKYIFISHEIYLVEIYHMKKRG